RDVSNKSAHVFANNSELQSLRAQLAAKNEEIASKDKLISSLQSALDKRTEELNKVEDELYMELAGHKQTMSELTACQKGRDEDKEQSTREIERLNDMLNQQSWLQT
ncbi:hypothetical protein H0H93_004532, partial [Arthromyces matolae]